MVADKIKEVREKAGYSQTELAKRLDVTRSSVNAWEMGVSMPTAQYLVALSKLFHVSTDYLLGIESSISVRLDSYSEEEIALIYGMLKYFDKQKRNSDNTRFA